MESEIGCLSARGLHHRWWSSRCGENLGMRTPPNPVMAHRILCPQSAGWATRVPGVSCFLSCFLTGGRRPSSPEIARGGIFRKIRAMGISCVFCATDSTCPDRQVASHREAKPSSVMGEPVVFRRASSPGSMSVHSRPSHA